MDQTILKPLFLCGQGCVSVSQDPEDNMYCVWYGDSYVSSLDTLETATQYAQAFSRTNRLD